MTGHPSTPGRPGFGAVCDTDEVWMGEMACFDVGTGGVIVVHTEVGWRAYVNACPHQGLPLAAGDLDGHELRCPAHGWSFDVCTGRGIEPASARLRPHPLRIVDGRVELWTEVDR